MAAPAVLFDIDGTLVDSNYLHIHAWQRAFAVMGIDAEAWRIHQRIGMDGTTLINELVPDIADDDADRLTALHSRFYLENTGLLRLLPGALQLLDAVEGAGLQVVLATSAPEDELVELRKVLDRDAIVSAFTSSEDVGTAKPEPDIVQIALARADVGPSQAVFVGDAVWDVRAAARADVQCIGLRSGGTDPRLLEAEGAAAVFDNAADLNAHLADTAIGRLASAATPAT